MNCFVTCMFAKSITNVPCSSIVPSSCGRGQWKSITHLIDTMESSVAGRRDSRDVQGWKFEVWWHVFVNGANQKNPRLTFVPQRRIITITYTHK